MTNYEKDIMDLIPGATPKEKFENIGSILQKGGSKYPLIFFSQDDKEAYSTAWALLESKGLNVGERLKVRNAFAKWVKQFDDNTEYDHKHQNWRSKKVTGYNFAGENEVKLLNALHDLVPDMDKEKLMTIFKIILKLSDIKSEWVL